MTDVLPQLFDAKDDAAHRSTFSEWFRAVPTGILACATAIAQSGRVPAPGVAAAALAEVAALDRTNPVAMREELTLTLVGRNVHLALQWLHDAGALARL